MPKKGDEKIRTSQNTSWLASSKLRAISLTTDAAKVLYFALNDPLLKGF